MKRINKILCLLFIIPLFAMCFVGCSSENKTTEQITTQSVENQTQNETTQTSTTTIDLTSDNIKEYLIFSYEILSYEILSKTREYPSGTYYNTILYNLKISATSKLTNAKFNDCSFNFYPVDNPKPYNNVLISINENGDGFNSMLYSYEYLTTYYDYINYKLQLINEQNFTIKNVTGTVTIGE